MPPEARYEADNHTKNQKTNMFTKDKKHMIFLPPEAQCEADNHMFNKYDKEYCLNQLLYFVFVFPSYYFIICLILFLIHFYLII